MSLAKVISWTMLEICAGVQDGTKPCFSNQVVVGGRGQFINVAYAMVPE